VMRQFLQQGLRENVDVITSFQQLHMILNQPQAN